MKAFFNKINTYLIKNKPFHWIIGWHIFIPMLLLLFIIAILFAFGFSIKIYNYRSESRDFIAFFLGFISLMGFILFIIRQAKYNSFRIHHHIPFKKAYLVFASFWLITTLFAVIPFIPELAYTARITHYINQKTTEFDADKKALCYGSSFFKSDQKTSSDIKKQQNLNSDFTLLTVEKVNIPYNIEMVFAPNDSVIIKDAKNNYNYYKSNKFPLYLSKTNALVIIEKFIKTAQKYDIKLTDDNPESIFNKRKQFYFSQDTNTEFSLYQKPTSSTYNSPGRAYDYMISNYDRYYNDIDDFFKVLLGILIFSVIIALILWVFVSVPLAQFGYAVLFSVLLAIFIGVVSVILGISSAGESSFYLVYIMISLFVYFQAFIAKSKWSQVFQIVSHVVFSFLLLMFLVLLEQSDIIDNNEFYSFSFLFIIGMLLSVLLYKPVYKKNMIIPQA